MATGIVCTWWQMKKADEQIRDELLQQSTLVSWALDADQIVSLKGNRSDLNSPVYQRIKSQLMETRELYPSCRFLYLTRRNAEGKIVFLVDSEPETSENYSPPGQEYEEATKEFQNVFVKGVSATEGPVSDRWGTWVSSMVPVFHPGNSSLVAVLGMDVHARRWRSLVVFRGLPPLIFTIVMMAILTIGYSMLRLRERRPEAFKGHLLWSVEAVAAGAAGIVMTILFVYLARQVETLDRRDDFRRLATAQAKLLQQAICRIGDNNLEALASFFECSEFVDRDEFSRFIVFLQHRPQAHSWRWIPRVAAEGRSTFEQQVRAGGDPDFEIWEAGSDGSRHPPGDRPYYYPICYAEPSAKNHGIRGLDEATDPVQWEAMDAAVKTRLMTASDPGRVWIGDGHWEKGITLYRPIFHPQDPRNLLGFVSAVIRVDALLWRTFAGDSAKSEEMIVADFYQLRRGEPLLLASNDPLGLKSAIQNTSSFERSDVFRISAPIFAFGKVYALVARPAPRFHDRRLVSTSWRVTWAGLLITSMLSALVGILGNRRHLLEKEVESRTMALRESEESYRGLFNSIRQAIYILNDKGEFIDVNEGAQDLYGYSREEFMGKTPAFLSAPNRNDPTIAMRALGLAFAGQPQFFNFWGLRKNGSVFPKDVWLCKGIYFGKSVVIAIANDISERLSAESERVRLQAQLNQSQKLESVGRLAGGVAHDFNNMLQAIMGNAALALEEAPAGSSLRESIEEIQHSAERAADLTRQLLAFASRQTARPRVLNLNETIEGLLKMLRRLIGEDIDLSWQPQADLWPVKIDPTQIDQVLANLVANARDAIAGVGRVTIETSNLSCDDERCLNLHDGCKPDSEYVVIRVSDNGKGMDEETRVHVFEPFFTTKPAGKGVGLGLATVFGIVNQNNGFINVTSQLGRGSSFEIGLPRCAESLAPKPQPENPPGRPGGQETILLVEDEKTVLAFGRASLSRLGYNVLPAGTPKEALAIAESAGAIHLLITDVVLPGMNGRDLAAEIVRKKPGIKCLYMSGYTADVIAHRGILDENVDFIAKPFTIDAVAAKVRDILSRQTAKDISGTNTNK